jgi:outer membrane lipoprotein SlyB
MSVIVNQLKDIQRLTHRQMWGQSPSNLPMDTSDGMGAYNLAQGMAQYYAPQNMARIGGPQRRNPYETYQEQQVGGMTSGANDTKIDFSSAGDLASSVISNKNPAVGAVAGKVMGGIGGVVGLAGLVSDQQAPAEAINTNAPSADTDSFGKPAYNLGAFMGETSGIQPYGVTGGEALSGVLQGAGSGFAVGGPVGAVVGGIIGGVTSLFGGSSREDEMKRKKELAQSNIRQAQKLYNSALNSYNSAETAKNSYYNSLNNQKGAQNLYRYNNAV